MSLLSSITTGKKSIAQIITLFGINGVGKTTWAAGFPSPIIVDLENGSNHLDVARVPSASVPTLSSFISLIKEILEMSNSYKTLVVDSVESLESLISDAVCAEGKVESIENYGGGYGKGFTRSREIMREIMSLFQKLQAKGVTVILVAHAQVKSQTDPATNQTYDRYIMRCNDKMASIIKDLSDNVLFATHKVFTAKDGNKTLAVSEGQRVLLTQWRPGFDAKNRLGLPLEIPLSYDAFIEACSVKEDDKSNEILADINSMAEKFDDKLRAQVKAMIEKYKTNPQKLSDLKNRVMTMAAS